jgi:hypothetical protein
MRKVKVFFCCHYWLDPYSSQQRPWRLTDRIKSKIKPFSHEIVKLIDHPQPGYSAGKDLTANLRLMVNGENELIVLDSGTDDVLLDSYIKSKLNYKKVNARDINYFKFYFVKVEFKS